MLLSGRKQVLVLQCWLLVSVLVQDLGLALTLQCWLLVSVLVLQCWLLVSVLAQVKFS